jgi:hypothetical protein
MTKPVAEQPGTTDSLYDQAIALRRDGWSVNDIAVRLAIARSTAWLWVRHLPLDPDSERARRKRTHAKLMADARWRKHRIDRDARRAGVQDEGSNWVGLLSERELVLLGAAIYWCEGTKEKAGNPQARIIFTNSDPQLIGLFLRFLAAVGIQDEEIAFRLYIHESADIPGAEHWWVKRSGVSPQRFLRTSLKRHQPKTSRHNVTEEYHGCVSVTVRKGRELYWRIEGLMAGIAAAVAGATSAEVAG